MMVMMRWLGVCFLLLLSTGAAAPPPQAQLHEPLDKILDLYVRDGYVYYLALLKSRAPLDRYLASLDVPARTVESWPKADQEAFWINGYNAFVLKTVIDAYPIKGRSQDYPAKSIRQIPGAFEQQRHRIGGKSLTLDEIENNELAPFGDPRLVVALGRGAIGSGRLRSEVFTGANLEAQLTDVVKECASRVNCVKVDKTQQVLEVSPLFSWREKQLTQSPPSGDRWQNRSPIERVVAEMVFPHLFPTERDLLTANKWTMKYGQFDWRLNDLTGGVPD